jgi:hypothetical protein
MATRFLSRARNDPKKAFKLMVETQRWRESYFRDGPVTDAEIEKDSRHGIVYFTGRDNKLRPAIVVRAERIPQQWYKEKRVDKLIRLIIFCMEYFLRYLVVPGRVENLSVITDMRGLGLAQVPLGALNEVHKVLGVHYIGRVFKFYLCNVSPSLWAIAGMVKAMLTDRQREKVTVLDNPIELRNDFSLHQLEDDLGGTRRKIEVSTSESRFLPFPLAAGPFEAGFKDGPDIHAVPNVHMSWSAHAAIGRLWNPKYDREENVALECAPVVPLELIRESTGASAKVKALAANTCDSSTNASSSNAGDRAGGLSDLATWSSAADNEEAFRQLSSFRSRPVPALGRSSRPATSGLGFFGFFACCRNYDTSPSQEFSL